MCQLNTQHTISSVVVFCFDYLIVCLLAFFDEKIVAIVLIFYWSLGSTDNRYSHSSKSQSSSSLASSMKDSVIN